MQMVPARDMPLLADKCVIVNLQKTCKDSEATMVIHSQVDTVLSGVIERFNLRFPIYRHSVRFFLRLQSQRSRSIYSWRLDVVDASGLGDHRLPFLESIDVEFPLAPHLKQPCRVLRQPFSLSRRTSASSCNFDGSGGGGSSSLFAVAATFSFAAVGNKPSREPLLVTHDFDLDQAEQRIECKALLFEADFNQ
jgi:hypothetical protein